MTYSLWYPQPHTNTLVWPYIKVCLSECVSLFVAEISNLLVVTKERAPAPQTPIQDSQLSFIRILKEDIEQVQPSSAIFMSVSHATMVLQFL